MSVLLTEGARSAQPLDEILSAALNEEDAELVPAGPPGPTRTPVNPANDRRRSQFRAEANKARLKRVKARYFPPAAAIILHHRRRECSLEETMLEIYFAGISFSRAEAIAGALWGPTLTPSAISALSQKIIRRITAWLNRPISGHYAYVFLHPIH